MFLDTQTVAVTLDGNTILLRQHLTLAQDAHFRGEMTAAGREFEYYLSDAQWEWLLLRAYIADWSGPAFTQNGKPVECTPDSINALDPNDPLVVKARAEVWKIYRPKLPDDKPKGQKKRPTPSGSASSTATSPS
jgi:hypothetical protein